MDTTPSAAIAIDDVSKIYDPFSPAPVPAVDHLTLTVPVGQVVGILGPNAAGKTTLLKLIAGVERPTTGHVLVHGRDVALARAATRRQLGVLLDAGLPRRSQTSMWTSLLRNGQRMNGGLDLEVRAAHLLHTLGLWEQRHEPLHTLSSGMQRKVALARALIADPPIILVDEPTLELDERSTRAVGQWLAGLAHEQGKPVLLTTRQPQVASAICDRVVLMRQGRLMADLPVAQLRTLLRGQCYHIRVKGQLGSQWSAWFEGLTVLPGGGDETILRGTIVDQAALHGLIGKVRDLGLPLLAVTREELRLDEVFARLADTGTAGAIGPKD